VLRRVLPGAAASALGDAMSAVFGVWAAIGELAAPFLRRRPVWPVMTGIVLGWGLALVPLGLNTPLWASLAAFFTGAMIWGPWMSLSMRCSRTPARRPRWRR
jgi:MFS transporter, DHA3 family, macrolide efflux protein